MRRGDSQKIRRRKPIGKSAVAPRLRAQPQPTPNSSDTASNVAAVIRADLHQ